MAAQPHSAVNLDAAFGEARPSDDLLVDGQGRFSTAELESAVGETAAGLAAAGVCVGDTVAFQLPITAQSVIAYRACWRIGAVAAALHPAAGSAQLAAALEQLDAHLVIADPSMALAANTSALTVEALRIGGLGEAVSAISTANESTDATILFTSGSSGAPKGVVHTHGSLFYKARQSAVVHGLGVDDAVLMPAPLAHMSGLLHAVTVPGCAGFKAVLMNRWDPGLALTLIENEQITYMVGPPTFFIGLMDHPDFDPSRTASLRMLSCGGAGVTPAFVQRASEQLGAMVKRAYGSTEAPTLTTSRFDDPVETMARSDGRTFDDTEVRVDDSGEIWARGPELARGYLDEVQTEAAFVDGWFRTGDLGVLTDGWLTITGRLGDVIIRAGENISAGEVEQVLEAHPDVRHAVAIAEPDDRLGERVAAFVVAPDGFTLVKCREWFQESGAAKYICPERIELIDAMPVLASGKPDRAALKDLLAT
ncbi:MAG: AMP-binding protein [Acidobacteria bacterium]|nr:AMP-binding protein [Acidobacteriota bacterium]